MAKGVKPKKGKPSSKPVPPDHLTMRLFAPGMSVLHRAGLGGLTCTLKYIERAYQQGALADDDIPGGPWTDGLPPWRIEDDEVTLRFGEPPNAAAYLKNLFACAFQIKDGLIHLPGQYGDVPPPMAVRSELQNGLLLTLYDHGPQSRKVREVSEDTVEVDDKPIRYRAARIEWYKHQRDGAKLALQSLTDNVPLSRMLFPGAIVRHDKFKQSAVAMGANLLVPLLFAPVGVFGLRMGARRVTIRGRRVTKHGGVLVIPDFASLTDVQYVLPVLIPNEPRATHVGSMSDALLAAEVRLQAAGRLSAGNIVAIRSVWCCATNWQSQLQPPSAVIEVTTAAISPMVLERYGIALSYLPTQIRTKVVKEQATSGETQVSPRREEHFFSDSVIRPFVAENLARDRPWYSSFAKLMTNTNPATDKPYRDQLHFERKGLLDMIADDKMWDEAGERAVVQAVHEAMRMRYGQIADENQGNSAAMKSRWKRFREKLRLDLAGGKTEADIRFALMDLFSRGGNNAILRDGWQSVLPIIRKEWHLARDLGLLALASYAGQDSDGNENQLESK